MRRTQKESHLDELNTQLGAALVRNGQRRLGRLPCRLRVHRCLPRLVCFARGLLELLLHGRALLPRRARRRLACCLALGHRLAELRAQRLRLLLMTRRDRRRRRRRALPLGLQRPEEIVGDRERSWEIGGDRGRSEEIVRDRRRSCEIVRDRARFGGGRTRSAGEASA